MNKKKKEFVHLSLRSLAVCLLFYVAYCNRSKRQNANARDLFVEYSKV